MTPKKNWGQLKIIVFITVDRLLGNLQHNAKKKTKKNTSAYKIINICSRHTLEDILFLVPAQNF